MIEVHALGPGDGDLLDRAARAFGVAMPSGDAFLAEPGAVAHVAVDGNAVVGWAWGFREVRPDGRIQVLLYAVEVVEAYRRRGIGTRLVRAVLDRAATTGAGRVWLVTNNTNAAAVATYERLGARSTSDDDVVFCWEF